MPDNHIIELLTEAHGMVCCITDMRRRLQFLIRLIEIIEDLMKIKAVRKPPSNDGDDGNGIVDR